MTEFPEPRGALADPAALLARYLEFYRATVLRKLRSLPEAELRSSRLPSGWTPLELLSHLAHMERRWFVWGFLGEDVADPWGDGRDDRWHVPADRSLEELAGFLDEVAARTDEALSSYPVTAQAPPGPRFDDEPPTLAWIGFHVLQEYARHAGHLDVVVEIAVGEVGE